MRPQGAREELEGTLQRACPELVAAPSLSENAIIIIIISREAGGG